MRMKVEIKRIHRALRKTQPFSDLHHLESTTAATEPDCACPQPYENWVDDNGYCFKLLEEPGNLNQSQSICRDLDNGTVAIVRSSELNQAIVDKLTEGGKRGRKIIFPLQSIRFFFVHESYY